MRELFYSVNSFEERVKPDTVLVKINLVVTNNLLVLLYIERMSSGLERLRENSSGEIINVYRFQITVGYSSFDFRSLRNVPLPVKERVFKGLDTDLKPEVRKYDLT